MFLQMSRKERLNEISTSSKNTQSLPYRRISRKTVCVLIEKASKRSNDHWSGRTTQNTVVVFPKENYQVGDFVDVKKLKIVPLLPWEQPDILNEIYEEQHGKPTKYFQLTVGIIGPAGEHSTRASEKALQKWRVQIFRFWSQEKAV